MPSDPNVFLQKQDMDSFLPDFCVAPETETWDLEGGRFAELRPPFSAPDGRAESNEDSGRSRWNTVNTSD